MIFDPKYKEVDIKGYEGLYKISNRGDVISLSKISGFLKLRERIMTPTVKANKYLDVKVIKNKISKHFYVHRLVAEHFIPNPNNLPQVNHKDNNPANNNVDNLEWCDNSYNIRYSDIPNKLKELRGDKLEITNIETKEIIIAKSKREAADIINGTDTGIIYAIKNNSIYKNKYKIKVLSYGCK